MAEVFNFSSGPSMLPKDVLQQAQRELCNWNNLSTSIMEISHRSKEFLQVVEEIKQDVHDLLNVPKNYRILLCHGGGRGQFSALPLNLLGNKSKADYIDTGYWSSGAAKEGKKYCSINIIDAKIIINGKYGVSSMKKWNLSHDSAYMHYCPNETIHGVAVYDVPNFEEDIVVTADFSSMILSFPINISRFGMIYASSQKNIGPAGFALVIIREDLLGKVSKTCPSILDYTLLNKNNSIFNTPPTFSWYLASLVFKWLKKKGGVSTMNVLSKKKSDLLYNVIDSSHFYFNDVLKENRSRTNIPFKLRSKNLEALFLKESFAIGLHALNGHRVFGGMRASIYNAMPLSGVTALTDFMIDFERRHG